MHFSIEVVIAERMEIGAIFATFFVPVFCFAALGTEFVVCGVTLEFFAAVFACAALRVGNLFGGILFLENFFCNRFSVTFSFAGTFVSVFRCFLREFEIDEFFKITRKNI